MGAPDAWQDPLFQPASEGKDRLLDPAVKHGGQENHRGDGRQAPRLGKPGRERQKTR